MEEGTKPVAHYEIKDISELPMPPDQRGRSPKAAGKHAALAVGQGFTVPISELKHVRALAFRYWKRRGGKIVTRKIDAETGGIWRVE